MLALTAGEAELRRRMTEGRGIADLEWIQGSVDYDRYFSEHDNIEGVYYDTLDVSKLTVQEAARELERWALGKL